jgi:hypothetical protein
MSKLAEASRITGMECSNLLWAFRVLVVVELVSGQPLLVVAVVMARTYA